MISGGVYNSGNNFGSQAGNVISGGNFTHYGPGVMVNGFVNNTGINRPGGQQAGNVITAGNFWRL